MSSTIFGLQSLYMLEYHWLFALFLRGSARCFTHAQGEVEWTPHPPIFLHLLPPSFRIINILWILYSRDIQVANISLFLWVVFLFFFLYFLQASLVCFLNYLFLFNLYCIFSLPFRPFIPPSPSSNHYTVVHVLESFFLFAQSLHTLNSSQLAVICFPSMSLSLFCLLVQFVH